MISLVRELMAREEVGGSLRNQRFPILVVEGFRGAGKTALLTALDGLLDQRVPYARLDFEVDRHASVPQVLSALAFELSRKCPRYGVLQFPRFIVGQLVMGLELDLTVHVQARRQVVAALERQRGVDAIRDVLVETAGDVLKTTGTSSGLPVEPPGRYVFERSLKWLTARAPGRIVLGSFQDWYGHRDLGLTNDSVDVLVDLNRWAKDAKDEDSQQRVHDLLWAAFLADLRAEFDRGRRADERSLNCVVLLDNAETVLGRRFLNELVRARRQRVAGGQDDADPLTVVATSRGALLADVPSADQALVTPDNARFGELSRTTDRYRPWWLQYRLPDLTEDEVGIAVAALSLDRSNNQRLTRVIFQLTGGHPASTRLVLDALAERFPEDRIEPETILSQRRPGAGSQPPQTVEDQILSRLLVEQRLRAANLTVLFAARTDARGWSQNAPGTPERYQDFLLAFTEAGFDPGHLEDDRAILTHDALLTAAKAVRLAAPGASPPGAPTASDVLAQLLNLNSLNNVPGAGGTLSFSFRAQGAGNPQGKPVLVFQFPSSTPNLPQQVGPTYITP